ncbi:MAG: phosphotransferase [Deltaproteobacteria bacterium]|nr:phosphotransferase [Deltaproteobacteria bacterium]MBT4264059.1 phosphotransferase [Deltaproteobacteria bacterium]MBT4640659.1 phosphotransferase [Deltaproteobacteria bacterium]MBT6505086.1 phosphotransferase [Deltaproteobacteria bacterium]MBT6615156.1 phosphotransferase [Deltaproteobacteria bacterium]
MEKVINTGIYADLIPLAEDFFDNPLAIVDPLKGDGSDRSIYRIFSVENHQPPVVGVIHRNVSENQDFFLLTQKFQETGLCVPQIYSVNSAENAYLLQDLGQDTLADKITEWHAENRKDKILDAYQLVLDSLCMMQHELPSVLTEFFKNRIMDVSVYQADLDYFKRDFIDRFEFDSWLSLRVKHELHSILFEHFADLDVGYFVYRDFQARNIMWLDNTPWFIDYQSAFLGPRYYDMASLLYGSKSGLDESARESLNRYYYGLLQPTPLLSFEKYEALFYFFVVLRRLRSLGTYGYLSSVKGKTAFFDSIYPTLEELVRLFHSQPCLRQFVNLFGMMRKVKDIWEQRGDEFRSRLTKSLERNKPV